MATSPNVKIKIDESAFVSHFRPLLGKYAKHSRKILYGSRESAKSHFAGQYMITAALQRPYFRGVLVRKVYDSIRGSQFQKLIDIIKDWKLDKMPHVKYDGKMRPFVKYSESPHAPIIIKFYNGNMIIGKGLDKPSKIKSLADPTFVWYEEAEEISEQEYQKVSFSLRSNKTDFLEEFIVFNPPPIGEDFWVIKDYFPENWRSYERSDGMHTYIPARTLEGFEQDTVILHTCYKHNPYVPKGKIQKFEELRIRKPEEYKVDGLGLIRKKKSGNRFYSAFHDAHIKDVVYNPRLPLHISWDFNIRPYQTCVVSQLEQLNPHHYRLSFIDEVLGRYPHNNPRATSLLFANRYKHHKEKVFLYGDPAGNAGDRRYFSIIKNTLSPSLQEIAVLKKLGKNHEIKNFQVENRASSKQFLVTPRRMFLNDIFSGDAPGGLILEVFVSPNCVELIRDLEFTKEDINGRKDKKKVKDEDGNYYEEYGHTGDAMDYQIVRMFIAYYDAFRRSL